MTKTWTVRHFGWIVVGLISLGTIINYLSRNSLAVLAPQLQGELGFSEREYSYVIGAFQLTYTLMQPVCGYVLDLVGVRAGFAGFAIFWSIAGMAHALASGWAGLAIARGLLGAGEAAAIPAGMKAISEWFAGASLSKAVAWFNVGTSLGAMLAPPLTIALTLAYGWQAAFIGISVLGILWAGLWSVIYRSPPKSEQSTSERASWRTIIITRRYWALAIPRFLAEPAWQTFSFWVPLYLSSERHWDLKQIALFAWLPFLAADLGGLAGGYISPFLVSRFQLSVLAARQWTMALGAVMMIAPGLVSLMDDAYGAIILLCIGGFAHQIISVTINTLSADLFSSHELGVANGLVGSAGWIGGLLFSLMIGQVVHVTGYAPIFAGLGLFDLIGAGILVWLMSGLTTQQIRAEGTR
jgi:ACS family hexuronate transporter-like MFS transporter